MNIKDVLEKELELAGAEVMETIRPELVKRLNKASMDIVRGFLGFEKDSWGRGEWKVDHCNGRAGESFVGTAIRKRVSTVVDDWITKNMTEQRICKALEKSMKAAEAEIEEHVKKAIYEETIRLKDTVRDQVKEKIADIVAEKLEEAIK